MKEHIKTLILFIASFWAAYHLGGAVVGHDAGIGAVILLGFAAQIFIVIIYMSCWAIVENNKEEENESEGEPEPSKTS